MNGFCYQITQIEKYVLRIYVVVDRFYFVWPVESTNFIMNTYVNVAFLRLLLSAEQLAKSDQHLEEELMFCAQANPLSQ